MAQDSNAPRSQEDYISQVFEEIEGGVTKKMSKGYSSTERRILGALTRLDEFFFEFDNTGLLRIRSEDSPERPWNKPGNECGRFLELSSSWSERLSEPKYTKLWPTS